MIQRRICHEFLVSWTFQAGVSGGSSVADGTLQVVMPEGRTPGRHDGRNAEVRRFSPLSLRRHPSSRARRHSYAFSLFLLPTDLCPRAAVYLTKLFVHLFFLLFEKKVEKINTLTRDKAYQAPVGTLVPSACPLFTTAPSFCHQALVRVNMMTYGNERGGVSTSRRDFSQDRRGN